jgi:hypothetical protein
MRDPHRGLDASRGIADPNDRVGVASFHADGDYVTWLGELEGILEQI